MVWAKTNIKWTPNQVVDKQNNETLVPIKKDWALSKSKKMHHTVEVTEFHLAVNNLSKLIAATVAGMVGNVPGILQAVYDGRKRQTLWTRETLFTKIFLVRHFS